MSGGVHVLLLQHWMKPELLACLIWLLDTVKANGQQGAQKLASTRVQNVQIPGEDMEQEDLNDL